MRTELRKTVKMMMGITALLVVTGCNEKMPLRYQEKEVLNEVVDTIMRLHAHGVFITCVEQKDVTADNGSKGRDVYVVNAGHVLQTYRIEGHKVLNVRSLRMRHLRNTTVHEEYRDVFASVIKSNDTTKLTNERIITLAQKVLTQLPNMLTLNEAPQLFKNNPMVTIVDMGIYPSSSSLPSNKVCWNNIWWVQQWLGSADAFPIVETFCQSMMEIEADSVPCEYECFFEDYPHFARIVAALPNIGSYPAYLRAVPLFTEKDLAVEKDTPQVALKKTRENVHYAVQYPYTLFPIPPGRSPFPSIRNYTAGDKFKVNVGNECFLIETFANGNLKKNTQKYSEL